MWGGAWGQHALQDTESHPTLSPRPDPAALGPMPQPQWTPHHPCGGRLLPGTAGRAFSSPPFPLLPGGGAPACPSSNHLPSRPCLGAQNTGYFVSIPLSLERTYFTSFLKASYTGGVEFFNRIFLCLSDCISSRNIHSWSGPSWKLLSLEDKSDANCMRWGNFFARPDRT